MSGQLRINKRHRTERRLANIERRLDQLDRDFEAANSVEAELRINDAIARQLVYRQRVMRRLEGLL